MEWSLEMSAFPGGITAAMLIPIPLMSKPVQEVNNNGYLTFNEASAEYVPYSFPGYESQDIIAGLWTNLNNSVRGFVSYQQYTSGNILTRATQDINTHFPNLTFNASWVFVATWNKVAYSNLTSTAGYDTINSTHYFVIPGSNRGSFISNLRNSSNVDVPGRWAFRVDSGPRNSILKNNVVSFRVRLSSFSDLTESGNIEMLLHQETEMFKKCFLFILLAAPAIFYPFGSAAGDKTNPALDDGSSSVIQLSNPFLFFGRTYQQIYVNNNGLLTFNQPSSAYIPYSFPANRNQYIIAGLWTDLDNRVKGVVSYNQYTSGNIVTNATRDINTYFPKLNFNASWVFVATWNKVAYFNLTSTFLQDTSFQVVLISDRNSSFILMNYGDIAVTEHPVQVKETCFLYCKQNVTISYCIKGVTNAVTHSQAGYDTINSTHYFVIPGSNRGSFISNLRNSSNVDVPGRWAFMVAGEPDNVIGIQVRLSSFSDLTQSSNIEMVLQQMKQELVKYGLPNSVELKLRKRQKIKP
ncbi:hypothetical protein cypCar_00030538 [Cyprinus carpio]|nr:hypothetical protein cypCar_00030538 [Cyprinus carpio]